MNEKELTEPVSNYGRFGRMLLLAAGIALLTVGIFMMVKMNLIDRPAMTTAIVKSVVEETNMETGLVVTSTTVDYTVNHQPYSNTLLSSTRVSWHVGDKLRVYYDPENPDRIRTPVMAYFGNILILAGMPLIITAIFSMVTRRRRAAKTPEEIAEDEERTTSGRLKYKVSSIVIPIVFGIPCTTIGLIFTYLEHISIMGYLFTGMGLVMLYVGIRSIVIYCIIKYRHHSEKKTEQSETE